MLITDFMFVCFDSYFLQYCIIKDIIEKKQTKGTLKHSLDLVWSLLEVRFEEKTLFLLAQFNEIVCSKPILIINY